MRGAARVCFESQLHDAKVRGRWTSRFASVHRYGDGPRQARCSSLADPVFFRDRARIVESCRCDISAAGNRTCWREFAEAGGLIDLRTRTRQDMAGPGGRLRRPHSQGRQARRPAHRAAHEVRAGHQPQDRQGARPDDPTVAPAAGRSGDRVMDMAVLGQSTGNPDRLV